MSFEKAENAGEGSIRFDLFELDARSGELRRSGVVVDLPPQALKVLGILAGRPDELVTRKDLQEALWPGQAYGDFDSRLNFAVRKLRESLGDDAEQPRYVQTVRNAGYRFIAPVRGPQVSSSALPNSEEESIPNQDGAVPTDLRGTLAARSGFRMGRGGLFFAFVTVVLIVVGAEAVLMVRRRVRGPASVEAKMPGAEAHVATTNVEYEPQIDSVSAILPQARQRIVMAGRGFGLHVPYVHTDSPYLAIRDLTGRWAAGRMIPQNSDEVMVDVDSWTDTEVVVSGFSGDYGVKGWKLTPGDELEVAIWNPQSGVGPALYHVKVTPASTLQ